MGCHGTHRRVTGNARWGCPHGEKRLASRGAGEYSLRNQLASSFPAPNISCRKRPLRRDRLCGPCLLLRHSPPLSIGGVAPTGRENGPFARRY